ncbi:hypothetical protein [Reichenbachiella ulvae]|uniref:DUF4412 domain-containing protein n=1 Tax=Reichenbachiella ulvae TaxID=2980104 RepID=A0ABT3CXH3_9BACT|nr:hypothetical protein [Reichenbachiella ulvae]MCV9388401.1 hypothetical protein [Reichenbachiella ulvae]
MYKIFFITLLSIVSLNSVAQKILEPSKIYGAGEWVIVPEHGLELKIPENWNGYLARGTGIFRLDCDTTEASVLYFVHQQSESQIKSNWAKGFELASGLEVKLSDSVVTTESGMHARVHSTGSVKSRGYLLAKCGNFGNCITALMFTPAAYFKSFVNRQMAFLDALAFREPIERKEVFDWRKNLTGKMIFTYERQGSSTLEDKIWLDYNCSFKSKSDRTGIFKGTAGKYKGKKKGIYTIKNETSEQPAQLILDFDKLPSITFTLEIRDHKYYINDRPFFYSEM